MTINEAIKEAMRIHGGPISFMPGLAVKSFETGVDTLRTG